MNASVQPSRPFARLHTWLSPAGPPHAADLIFVLAGKTSRKEYALELFRENLAPRLLFSVGRFEIRRFSKMPLPVPIDLLSLAQELPPPQRHYFVFFDRQTVQTEHVPPKRFGTLNELQSFAAWHARHSHIRSILIVSSDAHLRRIRMCCQSLLPQSLELSFVAAPQTPDSSSGGILPFEDLQELTKVAAYWILLKLRRK
jgi:uncharacterized SAM-binding protein YcdF (DUF218 family)